MDAAPASAPTDVAAPNDGQLAGAAVLGGGTLQRVATPFVTAVSVQRPRDTKVVTAAAITEAALMREDFYWEWEVREKDPRTGKRRPKMLRGISIDGALSLLRIWGNCGYVPSLDAETPDKWTFLVSFVDYEYGTTSPRLYQRAKTQAPGDFDQERWEAMMFQDGQSKAIRNAIERSLPKWLVRKCIEAAKSAAVKALNSKETLQRERKDIVARAKELGLTSAQLKSKAGKNVSQYTAEDVVTMKALLKSIEDGDATTNQMFGNGAKEEPSSAEPRQSRKGSPPKDKQDTKAKGQKAKSETKKPPEPSLFEKLARKLKDSKDEMELDWAGTDVADAVDSKKVSKAEAEELQEIADMVLKKLSQQSEDK
jgi:hypothetical protein